MVCGMHIEKVWKIHIKLLTTVTPRDRGRIGEREGKREILIFSQPTSVLFEVFYNKNVLMNYWCN